MLTKNEIFHILSGLSNNVLVTVVAVCLGTLLGATICMLRLSRIAPLAALARVYVSIFRGIPLLIQLVFVYNGAKPALGLDLSPLEASLLVFSMNSAAYVSEIFRAGITSIDKGQWEAADSLALTRFQKMRYIIVPQAIQKVSPALVNELINLFKESALVSVITLNDIMRQAQNTVSQNYKYFEVYGLVALTFYICVLTLTQIARLLEQALNKSHGVNDD